MLSAASYIWINDSMFLVLRRLHVAKCLMSTTLSC